MKQISYCYVLLSDIEHVMIYTAQLKFSMDFEIASRFECFLTCRRNYKNDVSGFRDSTFASKGSIEEKNATEFSFSSLEQQRSYN